ncbi:GatB/YqeY domain-containing protein [Phyllobacterium sp. SYP-B3895]|uniref:GatB/YqeY domain-containing protein n=1 Tax=Phyllobacterium sp. SYP-B3895 TaxID=2663240 RepID=UPI001299CA49|nr:GatB/YqeY domain-containing protein [Phyllobacterium sp. SYP-B3895]MRG56716.1 GatB/YqeY domain-containing protein [Phyllobacterium sp. SYP-B3895]
MRDTIAQALTAAVKAQDKRRVPTLRLIMAAIKDRDILNRGTGKEPVTNEEISTILAKMIKQREESAKLYEDGGRQELAEQERAEIEIIRDFMPKQMSEAEIRAATSLVIAETEASGLRDMGKVMNALKEKYAGQMDFSKASALVKELLQ